MDYTFLFYIFLSIVTITGGAFYFFKRGMSVAGTIYFFGILVIAFIFGARWFSISGDENVTPSGTWPPMINYCPDFMTLYKTSSGTQVCVDTIGVALSGGLTKWDGNGTPDATTKQFNINPTLTAGQTRLQALCDSLSSKKLTWEGVYDGTTCLANEPPLPKA